MEPSMVITPPVLLMTVRPNGTRLVVHVSVVIGEVKIARTVVFASTSWNETLFRNVTAPVVFCDS